MRNRIYCPKMGCPWIYYVDNERSRCDLDVPHGSRTGADQALRDHIALHHDRVGLSDPLEGANCHFCGQTADNFHVSDGLWAKVAPALGKHQACFKCFRIAAWHVGLRPESAWEVTVG